MRQVIGELEQTMGMESATPDANAERSGAMLLPGHAQSDRQLLVLALAALPAWWLALRVLGLRRCLAWLDAHRCGRGTGVAPGGVLARARHLGLIVDVASAYAPGPVTCLSRSLLLVWMLGREGVAAELRIGVRMTGGALAAHAWVEASGVPVNDARDVARAYVPFADGLAQRRALSR